MFGNLITNRQLRSLIPRDLDIDPFDAQLMKDTHYTLLPGRVSRRSPDGKWHSCHSFYEEDAFELAPDEYVVVEVRQRIRIHSQGVVGRFIAASNNVEGGLLVVAGQIDYKYGTQGESLRFGVKNLLPVRNELRKDTRLAHVEFFDLRAITFEPRKPSPVEERIWSSRRERADSDGVYDEDA